MSNKGKISVNFVVRNSVKQGYPFWDSLESCLPFADEIVISEGYSEDNTYDYIQEFAKRHPKKVKVFRDRWVKRSGHGEIIAHISNINHKRCTGEWIYYLQADEIIHEQNHNFIMDIVANHSHEFEAVAFRFAHFIGAWKPLPKGRAYDEAIRFVKNSKSIKLIGDAWQFGGGVTPTCPAGLSDKPIYHLAWVFPGNTDEKRIEHGKIYLDMKGYQKHAQTAVDRKSNGISADKPLPIPKDYDDYPELMRRLVGELKYSFPEGVVA